ncbi:hypothetical protein ACFQ1I_07275 [Kitasatospora arboriphila]
MPRLQTGTTAPVRQFTDVTGAPAARPGPEGLLHLQFRRFAAARSATSTCGPSPNGRPNSPPPACARRWSSTRPPTS